MNVIDYIILGIFFFSFWNGWKKGVLRIIIGPGALFLATIASLLYFQKTQNLLMSLLIGILGPFGLHFAFSFILSIWQKTTNPDKEISPLGSFLGAIFSCVWNIFFTTLFLALILLIPSTLGNINSVQQPIKNSFTYSLISQWNPNQASKIDRLQSTFLSLKDPEHISAFESSPEFKEIMNNSKVKDILSDKDLLEHIQAKEITKVLSNPKFQELLKDKKMIENLFGLQKKLLENAKTKPDSPATPE